MGKKRGAPKGNKNAEKWDLETSTKLFEDAITLAREGNTIKVIDKDGDEVNQKVTYDFIGEVARDLKVYREIFVDLKDKFPNELRGMHKELLTVLESNCFSHTKKGQIVPSIGIVNLKSNHGWTDRHDFTTKDKEMKQQNLNLSHLSMDELRELMGDDE